MLAHLCSRQTRYQRERRDRRPSSVVCAERQLGGAAGAPSGRAPTGSPRRRCRSMPLNVATTCVSRRAHHSFTSDEQPLRLQQSGRIAGADASASCNAAPPNKCLQKRNACRGGFPAVGDVAHQQCIEAQHF